MANAIPGHSTGPCPPTQRILHHPKGLALSGYHHQETSLLGPSYPFHPVGRCPSGITSLRFQLEEICNFNGPS